MRAAILPRAVSAVQPKRCVASATRVPSARLRAIEVRFAVLPRERQSNVVGPDLCSRKPREVLLINFAVRRLPQHMLASVPPTLRGAMRTGVRF